MSLHATPCDSMSLHVTAGTSPVCDGHSHCNPLRGWEPQQAGYKMVMRYESQLFSDVSRSSQKTAAGPSAARAIF